MINYEDLTISQIRKDPTILKKLDEESLHRFQGGLAQTQGRVMRLINNPSSAILEPEGTAGDDDLQTYTAEQISEMLHVTKALVYDLMNKGELPFTTIRKFKRVKAEDLRAWMQKHYKGKVDNALYFKYNASREQRRASRTKAGHEINATAVRRNDRRGK
jgi:excisionase family DNA binding protein